jgi:ABC-type microcin C transport system duplicated ATPase subunit YejF
VESGPTQRIFEAPRSDYTRTLLRAAFDTSAGARADSAAE